MRRGATVRQVIRTNVDLTNATIFITYMQGKSVILEKTNGDFEVQARKIIVDLSQEETLGFTANTAVNIQVRYVMEDGTADVSNIVTTNVQDTLKDGEISYVAPTSSQTDDGE